MTTSTRYVIRHRKEPREYYAGPHTWVDAIEQAEPFEFLTVAECVAVIRLGLTEWDYAVELLTVIG